MDRQAIESVIVRLFVSTDRRDWPAVESCFAPLVDFDMTSLAGGEPAKRKPSEIAAGWREGLASLEAIHHQAGNFEIDVAGDAATARCYAIASHYRRVASGRNVRTFVGSYDFRLARRVDGWKIDLFRFNVKYVDGNLELEKEEPRK